MIYQKLLDTQTHLLELVQLLQAMHQEGEQLINAGYNDVNLPFIDTALTNLNLLAQQLETGILTQDVMLVIYVLLSIDSANRYFSETDLDWSNAWHSSPAFDVLQTSITTLLYEERLHEKPDLLKNSFQTKI